MTHVEIWNEVFNFWMNKNQKIASKMKKSISWHKILCTRAKNWLKDEKFNKNRSRDTNFVCESEKIVSSHKKSMSRDEKIHLSIKKMSSKQKKLSKHQKNVSRDQKNYNRHNFFCVAHKKISR